MSTSGESMGGATGDEPEELTIAVDNFETAVLLNLGALEVPDSPADIEPPQGDR